MLSVINTPHKVSISSRISNRPGRAMDRTRISSPLIGTRRLHAPSLTQPGKSPGWQSCLSVFGAAAFGTRQQSTQVVVIFQNATGATSHAGHGVFGQPAANVDFFAQALAQTAQLSTATRQRDAAFHQVGDQLWRRVVQRVFDCINDDIDRAANGFADLDGTDLDRVGQAVVRFRPLTV